MSGNELSDTAWVLCKSAELYEEVKGKEEGTEVILEFMENMLQDFQALIDKEKTDG